MNYYNMIKKSFVAFGFVLVMHTAWAQQDAMYSQYMFNYLSINPGYAGSRDVLSVTGLYRNQWVNVDGAPTTITVTADAPIARERMGIGLSVFSDKIGREANTGVYGTYAYRLRLSKKGTLGFGANVGFTQYTANLAGAISNKPETFGNITEFNPNFGFGVYYSTDKFYLSVSLPHILDSKLGSLQGSNVSSLARKHYFIGAGYVFTINPSVKLKPSFLIKAVEGAPVQADINANLWLVDRVGLGLLYRTGDAFAGLFELQVTPSFRFGYAYDLTTTRIGAYTAGTHELMLRYEFATNKKKIITPRYF
jgi:type IX secretion system PorP/SprF family membrane protein